MPTRDRFFEPEPPTYNMQAAYALGVLGLISYTNDRNKVQTWAQSFGYTYWALVETPGYLTPNVVVVGDLEDMIIAIPGTSDWRQMVNNIIYSAFRENAAFGDGRMHSFFLWCAESIIQHLGPAINAFPSIKRLCFVGHSLGGAVAQLLADWAAQNTPYTVRYCCTFNSPRVGDPTWARRIRPYTTHNYYCTHDIVCELPPAPETDNSVWHSFLGTCDIYEHRGILTPIQSRGNIDESWMAVSVTKASEGTHIGGQMVRASETASRFLHRFLRIGRILGIASWVLPIPTWAQEHSMQTVIDNIKAMPRFTPMAETNSMETLLALMPYGGDVIFSTPPSRFGILPPANFGPGEYSGGGGIANLPPVPTGKRIEIIEAAIEYDYAVPAPGQPELISVDDSFFNALASEAAITGGNPLTSALPLATGIPHRPHWLYRGKDRRILETFRDTIKSLYERDDRTRFAGPTAAISTRSVVIDPDDADTWDAFRFVWDRVNFLLSLFYAKDEPR